MTPGFRPFLFASILSAAAFFSAAPACAQQPPVPGAGANYETRLDGLEDQMRTLNGRIEQLEFNIRRLDQSMQRLQGDVDARLSKLEAAPPPVTVPAAASVASPTAPSVTTNIATNVPSAISAGGDAAVPPVAPVNGTLGSIKMQDGRVTGGSVNPQAPPLPATPPDYGLTPQEQYDHAFDLLRQASYDDAGAAFEDFIAKNPKDKLIDNAKYWYGETLYVRGKFDNAAVAFADAYQQNPQGNKAPDSLLKLAMSLENIDKVPDACTTLESLKSKYPNASVSIRQRADQERAKLKCGAAPAAH